jgi:hypothetical protein
MRWLVNGKLLWRLDKKYLINWDKPSRSKEQTKVKEFLREFWINDIVFEEYLLPKSGKLRTDFLNATKKIALEHQGKGAHNEFNPFFHNNSRINYLSSIKRDVKKAKILELNGYTLIETFTKDLENLSQEFFLKTYNINI